MLQILGYVIIGAVLGTFYIVSCTILGMRQATLVWLSSLSVITLVILGCYLIILPR